MQNLDQIAEEAAAAFAATDDPDALEQIKARYLGKSGRITELLKGMARLSPEERKTAGAAINRVKEAVEASLNARRDAIRRLALETRLAEESLDVTLPGRGNRVVACTLSPAHWNALKRCSAQLVSKSPTVRKSRLTSRISPH